MQPVPSRMGDAAGDAVVLHVTAGCDQDTNEGAWYFDGKGTVEW